MPEYRSAVGEIRFLGRQNDFIFPVELWLYNDADNRNNWRFVNLEQHRALWAGKPILIAYINNGQGIGDGHNQKVSTDPKTGKPAASFTGATAERIVGAISETADDIRLERRKGNTWVVAKGFLWAWYARELVDKIERDAGQGRDMSISIEALVHKSYMDGDIEVETDYLPLGVTILGDHVMPAVENAHIAMLSLDAAKFSELKIRAASYLESENAEGKPKNDKKGLRKHMRLSKQQVRDLQAKFGDDYTVLAAAQAKDNGAVTVCLMDKTGKTAVYVMQSVDETVVPERVQAVNAQVHFSAEGCDEDVVLDACDMVENMSASVADLTAKLNTATTELEKANNTISAMREAENKRRLSAAKEKATATLAAFNANRSEKVDAKILDAVNADIDAGTYTACADKDGAWTGDKAVEEKVLSLCAASVMDMDKKAAQNSKSVYAWERLASGEQDDGTVEALLARKGISTK